MRTTQTNPPSYPINRRYWLTPKGEQALALYDQLRQLDQIDN